MVGRGGTLLLLGLLVFGLLCPQNACAQSQSNEARVYQIKGDPFVVKNLTCGGSPHINATWRGASVIIKLEEVGSFSFLKPGQTLDVEISFRDGRKDSFYLACGAYNGVSTFGSWSMSANQISKVVFVQDGKGEIVSSDNSFDQVTLKNGDVISGTIKETKVKVRTSYGTLDFELQTVRVVVLEGGGQNIDVIELKIGDRISGQVIQDKLTITLRTGSELSVTLDKIT